MEEQNYEVQIKKVNFFNVNSSPEVVIHLHVVQKALHRSPEFCGNLLKLDQSELWQSNGSIASSVGICDRQAEHLRLAIKDHSVFI